MRKRFQGRFRYKGSTLLWTREIQCPHKDCIWAWIVMGRTVSQHLANLHTITIMNSRILLQLSKLVDILGLLLRFGKFSWTVNDLDPSECHSWHLVSCPTGEVVLHYAAKRYFLGVLQVVITRYFCSWLISVRSS